MAACEKSPEQVGYQGAGSGRAEHTHSITRVGEPPLQSRREGGINALAENAEYTFGANFRP